MAGDFKAHGVQGGPRLERQEGLGPGNFARRFQDLSDEEIGRSQDRLGAILAAAGAASGKPTKESPERAGRPSRPPLPSGKVGGVGLGGKKPKPWEDAGISRRTYFRRKKELKG